MKPIPLRGRGAATNPPNRFEPIELVPDEEWTDPDDPGPRTQLFGDASRTILAHNQSPDVGFETSINPYRGCEHGCVYCLGPQTPILYGDMSWRPIGGARVGDVLVGFDENPQPGRTRKFRPAVVEHVWWSKKPTLRLITKHTEVITTAEHRWLQARDFRWSRTDQLTAGRFLRYVPLVLPPEENEDYRAGYVAGISLGDATFRFEPGWRSDKRGFPQSYWRLALVDEEPLLRTRKYLQSFRVTAHVRPFSAPRPARKALQKVEVRSLDSLAVIHHLLRAERETESYYRGFLAGFFDAEGHNGESLRISQVNVPVLERVQRYGSLLGFRFELERRVGKASTLRLAGRLTDRIRFFSTCRPAIQRKIDGLLGRELNLHAEEVVAIEPGPVMDVVDIQTSTGTFHAAGLATHNCYARPTHEYFGLSAGLDFETKIFVKLDAPQLLRRELLAPKWQPQVIAISGVTDPYQPTERRLKITRGCLEVLAEFRNPVVIVTKNHLVTRDVDLLAELAQHHAAAVAVSVTSLDPELQRVMEPRTSIPARRLAAIAQLSAAGIPVRVMVAPVIPGLTDHEMPSIIAAAAQAGARGAGYITVRLPFAVKDLFEQWLETHFPDRKSKVLNRIREIRGGKLNDARFHTSMSGQGEYAQQLDQLFEAACRKASFPDDDGFALSTAAFRRPGEATQLDLW